MSPLRLPSAFAALWPGPDAHPWGDRGPSPLTRSLSPSVSLFSLFISRTVCETTTISTFSITRRSFGRTRSSFDIPVRTRNTLGIVCVHRPGDRLRWIEQSSANGHHLSTLNDPVLTPSPSSHSLAIALILRPERRLERKLGVFVKLQGGPSLETWLVFKQCLGSGS